MVAVRIGLAAFIALCCDSAPHSSSHEAEPRLASDHRQSTLVQSMPGAHMLQRSPFTSDTAAHSAEDLARHCGLRGEQLACYTVGAPRVGNHAYRQYSNENVPATWHVINDQDIVTKALKFGFMYKRCGHRVIVTSGGRLAVRPSFFEFLVLQVRWACCCEGNWCHLMKL